MMISTVNVIEMSEDRIIGLASYPDTPEGNEEAEKRFKAVANENGSFTLAQLENAIHNGVIEEGTWSMVLFHSNRGE